MPPRDFMSALQTLVSDEIAREDHERHAARMQVMEQQEKDDRDRASVLRIREVIALEQQAAALSEIARELAYQRTRK